MEIPVSDTPVGLSVAVGDLLRNGTIAGCDHEAYYFDNVPLPFDNSVYLSLIRH
jgi:hypothetical protein